MHLQRFLVGIPQRLALCHQALAVLDHAFPIGLQVAMCLQARRCQALAITEQGQECIEGV